MFPNGNIRNFEEDPIQFLNIFQNTISCDIFDINKKARNVQNYLFATV